jgi:hypothetical protein
VINSVTVYFKYRSLDPVSNTFQIGVRSAGTEYWSANKDTNPSTSYILFSETWTLDPDSSSAWDPINIDNIEIGVKKTNTIGGAITYGYVEVDYTPASPLASTISDNFNDNSINAQWSNFGSGQVVETNNRLEITTQAAANYFSLISVDTYDLQESYVSVELIDPGEQSYTTRQSILFVEIDSSNRVYLQVSNGLLEQIQIIGGSLTVVNSQTYDPVAHRYLRLSSSGGNFSWGWSADGLSYTDDTTANPIDVSAVKVGVQAGNYDTEAGDSTTIFDNFNVTPQGVAWFVA